MTLQDLEERFPRPNEEAIFSFSDIVLSGCGTQSYWQSGK